ncbi:MAG: DMT family transporter [Clostridiales bacterium]|nr:DMT family transporter [Clostridiales bacterium]
MVYWIVAFFNGFCNSINKMMNVKAGQVFGTANGALINYIEATFLSLALLFLTGRGAELSAENMARVPLWVYLGAVCGLLAMVLLIVGTLRTNVLLSSILTLVGNLGAAAVLDYLFYGIFSWYKIAGIALILLGTTWIEKTGQAAKQSADAE